MYDVVGTNLRIFRCIRARSSFFTDLKEGDFLAIMDTGAYGAVLANTYNAHPLPNGDFYFSRQSTVELHHSSMYSLIH